MLPFARRTVLTGLAAGCLLALEAAAVLAQARPEQTLFRTRRWLDSTATAIEAAAARASGETREALLADARSMRERLTVGDFYPGDQVVVELYGGEEPFRDTVSVRTGQELVLGRYPAFSVRGVLRSELDSALTVQARRILTQPIVRTTPLVRVLVTGGVGRPGFIKMRGDASVTDVVSAAGGLSPIALVNKSTLRRGTERQIGEDSLRVVLQSGMTLDQADIRAGDELRVAEKKQTNWLNVVWTGSILLGTVTTIVSLLR
jgi:protein involved in polysaccharide export with SLBB domain